MEKIEGNGAEVKIDEMRRLSTGNEERGGDSVDKSRKGR